MSIPATFVHNTELHSDCRANLPSLVSDTSDSEASTADDGLKDGMSEHVCKSECINLGVACVTYQENKGYGGVANIGTVVVIGTHAKAADVDDRADLQVTDMASVMPCVQYDIDELTDTSAINHAHDKAVKCYKIAANPCCATEVGCASGRDDSGKPGSVQHTTTYVSIPCMQAACDLGSKSLEYMPHADPHHLHQLPLRAKCTQHSDALPHYHPTGCEGQSAQIDATTKCADQPWSANWSTIEVMFECGMALEGSHWHTTYPSVTELRAILAPSTSLCDLVNHAKKIESRDVTDVHLLVTGKDACLQSTLCVSNSFGKIGCRTACNGHSTVECTAGPNRPGPRPRFVDVPLVGYFHHSFS